MKNNLLMKLYTDELKDLFSAENQLVKALPKMAKAATSPALRAGFDGHLKQTQEHVARLEKIFEALGESPNGKHCKGMEGLIKEGSELIAERPEEEQLDAGLIAAAQPQGLQTIQFKSPTMDRTGRRRSSRPEIPILCSTVMS